MKKTSNKDKTVQKKTEPLDLARCFQNTREDLSATPRTDEKEKWTHAQVWEGVCPPNAWDFARTLERENKQLRAKRTFPTLGHDEPCYFCGERCNALSGNPSEWPIPLCHEDEPGVAKAHHVGCVSGKLQQLTTTQVRLAEAITKLKELSTTFRCYLAGAIAMKQK